MQFPPPHWDALSRFLQLVKSSLPFRTHLRHHPLLEAFFGLSVWAQCPSSSFPLHSIPLSYPLSSFNGNYLLGGLLPFCRISSPHTWNLSLFRLFTSGSNKDLNKCQLRQMNWAKTGFCYVGRVPWFYCSFGSENWFYIVITETMEPKLRFTIQLPHRR